MIEIEKGVPLPRYSKTGKGHGCKYPWHEMEVGDSFLVPDYPLDKRGHATPIASAATQRYRPKRFIQRSTARGLRIWRVE